VEVISVHNVIDGCACFHMQCECHIDLANGHMQCNCHIDQWRLCLSQNVYLKNVTECGVLNVTQCGIYAM